MDTKPSNLKLCLICCSAFNTASTIASDAMNCREHLISFCKLLCNSPPQPPQQLDHLLQSSFPGLDQFLEDSGMSVCPECHCTITVAMEMGGSAERKEQEIRKLQKEILEKMTELQSELDGFHEEMAKVEKCIENSDLSCLMYHMSQSPFKDEDVTNGIVLIRDRITNVMADLRSFKERQNQILSADTNLFDVEQLYSQPEVSFEEEMDDDDDDYISYEPFEEPEMIRGTEGLLEAGEAPMFFGHTVFGHEGDYRFEVPKKSYNPEEEEDDDFEPPEESEAEENNDSDNESIKSLYIPTLKEKYAMKKAEKIKQIYASATAGAVKTAAAAEPITVPTAAAATYVPKRLQPQPPKLIVPKKGEGVFKKEVIEHVIAKEKSRVPEMDESSDLFKKYYLRYDPETEKLFVGDHEVIVNESQEMLDCSKCKIMGKGVGFRKQHWRDMEKNMVAHCIGKHLGGFPCQWCKETFTSYSALKLHRRRSHKDKKQRVVDKPYKCNLCDECFSTPVGLQGHFMRRHNKSLGKEEAKKQVIKPPKIRVKKQKGGESGTTAAGLLGARGSPAEIKFEIPKKSNRRPHECQVCKFAFTKSSHLKRHLAIHKKKGQLVEAKGKK